MKLHIILISCFFILFSCSQENKIIRTIEINTETKEKRYIFKNKELDTFRFKRIIKVLENTLNDTVMIGLVVIPPKQLGLLEYSRLKDRTDVLLDIRYSNPPADRIWITRYKDRIAKGVLKIELTEE